MPQMAPYNWMILNLFFLIIYLMILILINFNINKMPHLKSLLKLKNFNPKW